MCIIVISCQHNFIYSKIWWFLIFGRVNMLRWKVFWTKSLFFVSSLSSFETIFLGNRLNTITNFHSLSPSLISWWDTRHKVWHLYVSKVYCSTSLSDIVFGAAIFISLPTVFLNVFWLDWLMGVKGECSSVLYGNFFGKLLCFIAFKMVIHFCLSECLD